MRKFIYFICVFSLILICLMLITFSFIDGNTTVKISNMLYNFFNISLNNKEKLFFRKVIGHFCIYFIFGLISLLIFKNKLWFYFIIGIFLTCLTEIIQAFIPNRYFSFKDIYINIIGYMISGYLYILFSRLEWYYEMGYNVG